LINQAVDRRLETRVFKDILTGPRDEIDDAGRRLVFPDQLPAVDALEEHASRGAMVGIDREQHRFEHAIRCDLVDESYAFEFVTHIVNFGEGDDDAARL